MPLKESVHSKRDSKLLVDINIFVHQRCLEDKSICLHYNLLIQ